MSNDGLIIEDMDPSHIHLAVPNCTYLNSLQLVCFHPLPGKFKKYIFGYLYKWQCHMKSDHLQLIL